MGLFQWLRDQVDTYKEADRLTKMFAEATADPKSVKLPRAIATPGTMDEAVAILAELGLKSPKRMRPMENDGPDLVAMRLTGPLPRLRAIARRLNQPWRAAGHYVFLAAQGHGKFPPELGVVATRDHEDVMRFMGTCSWGDTQDELLRFLRELHAVEPFFLHEIEAAAIRGVFAERVADPAPWAERMLTLCPPLDDDGSDEEARECFRVALADAELVMEWDDPR